MLEIVVPEREIWDEVNNEFINTKECKLILEHSLVSLSKWESKWNKVFISKDDKSSEEILDYVRCMTINKNVDPNVYKVLTSENLKEINDYIEAPMTATFINERKTGGPSREPITSELIYYWMIANNIPFECEKWHLNRLIMLVRVCSLKNQPPKKMSKSELMNRNKALNAARRQKLGTTG